jgi:Holliday junction resolvasome RuvABC endonuclease subunit
VIVGLDLSIVRTGWAAGDGTTERGGDFRPSGGPGSYARHNQLRRWVNGMVQELRPRLAVIEGYAMGIDQPSSLIALGELGGVVRVELYRLGVPHVEVPPATLKKFATGRGHAEKPEMVAAAIAHLNYGAMTHDEADARWLLEMALDHYRFVESRVPTRQRASLAKVQWPELGS